VSHGEYADGTTDKQPDGQTPDRYFTLSAKHGQRKIKDNLISIKSYRPDTDTYRSECSTRTTKVFGKNYVYMLHATH